MIQTIRKNESPGLFSFLRKHLNYKKHSIMLSVLPDDGGVELHQPSWSGGSKEAYCWLNTLGAVTSVRFENHTSWPANPACEFFPIKMQCALVRLGTFCGKTATAHLYVRECDLKAFGLSQLQRFVAVR